MNLKTTCLLLSTIAMVFRPIDMLSAEDDSAILELLPRGMDTIDNTSAANLQRLVAMGEKAYPALAKELLRTTNPTIAGRIISIFSESEGDKKIPRGALRKFLTERKSAFGDKGRIQMMAANGLARIGEREDGALLQEMLREEPAPVKIAALRALAEIGGPESVEFLKNWKTNRPKRDAAAIEFSVDSEVEKAVGAIDRRRP
jgi:HEAT repeat protein